MFNITDEAFKKKNTIPEGASAIVADREELVSNILLLKKTSNVQEEQIKLLKTAVSRLKA